ncbi:uncharacterized protein LOC115447107 [Manduca sexta]|uniref:uncharacterized protein LOC115447107 n=1 Tax=Manduca sexta TaxID=7130 RepID=UPI00188F29D6|nr:uncharacterized protein LOC115447107 [Manduca sexta]
MTDKSGDENMANHHHLPGLDSVSEQSSRSESSVISIMPNIKISDRDQIRFDGMIGYSDESDDSNLDQTNTTNDKQYPVENQQSEVKLLSSSLKAADALAVTDLSVSGLSSFLNITGLSENLPISISTDFEQHLFQDKSQNKQTVTTESFSTDNDFSPSDGSDFDPQKAGFNTDDSCEKVTT